MDKCNQPWHLVDFLLLVLKAKSNCCSQSTNRCRNKGKTFTFFDSTKTVLWGGLKLLFILMMEKQWLFHAVNPVFSSWHRYFVFFMVDLFCIFHDVKIVCFSSLKLFQFFMVAFCCFLSTTLCCTTSFSALTSTTAFGLGLREIFHKFPSSEVNYVYKYYVKENLF